MNTLAKGVLVLVVLFAAWLLGFTVLNEVKRGLISILVIGGCFLVAHIVWWWAVQIWTGCK